MKLERKKVLFTGGGSGIALGLARRHAEANKVVIAGRDEAKLERAPLAEPRAAREQRRPLSPLPTRLYRRRDEQPAEGEHDGNEIPTE